MSNKKFVLFSVILFLLVATNILHDKYYRNYQIDELEINNGIRTSSSSVTFYGDGTNGGDVISTPEANLAKGEYKILIKYKTNTDGNYVRIAGKSKSKDISINEELDQSKKMKVIDLVLDENVNYLRVYVHFDGEGELLFRKVMVQSVQISFSDTIVWLFILTLVLGIFWKLSFYKATEESKKNAIVFLCLIAITIFASFPMFNDHILFGHDIGFHLTRIEGIKNALLAGQFPVRVHPSTQYDYGYAPSLFYPEFFLYFPALLRIAGVSTTGAVQIFIVCINFMTAGIMYFSVYKMTRVKTIGIISSIIYVLASYHLCDTYFRFALGETLAMAFIPLLIYGVYELIFHDYNKWPYAVLGAACIMQSHILTTLIATGFAILTAVIGFKNLLEKKRFMACIKAVVMTFLINLWFIIPFISMMKEDTKISDMATNVQNNTVHMMQLFQINNWLQIGFPILIGISVSIYCLVMRKIEDKGQENLAVVLLGFGLLSAFAATSLFPWSSIVEIPFLGEKAKMLQFPWRLLAFATAFLSIAAGYGFFYFTKAVEIQRAIVLSIFVLSTFCGLLYLDNNYLTNPTFIYKGAVVDDTGISSGEYYYKGTKKGDYLQRGEKIEASSEEVSIDSFERKKGRIYVTLENRTKEEQFIEVPLAYYPFYTAKLNDEIKLETEKGNDNVLRIIIPSNAKGNIQIQYSETKAWILADFISLVSVIVLIISFVRPYAHNKKRKFIEKQFNRMDEKG